MTFFTNPHKMKSSAVRSGDLCGQAMAPPLLIHQSENFRFKKAHTSLWNVGEHHHFETLIRGELVNSKILSHIQVHISGQCRLAEKDGTSDTIFHQPTPKVRFQCVPFILQHMRFSYPHIRQLRFFAFPQRWKVSSSEKQTVSRYEFSHQCMTASQSQILP